MVCLYSLASSRLDNSIPKLKDITQVLVIDIVIEEEEVIEDIEDIVDIVKVVEV